MRANQIGWFNPRSQTIKKQKDDTAGLPPLLWTDRDFEEFNKMYPELQNF